MTERACQGKARFTTRAQAKRVRRRLYANRGGTDKNGPLSIYHCETCDSYHLGHLPAGVRNGTWDRDEFTGVTHVRD